MRNRILLAIAQVLLSNIARRWSPSEDLTASTTALTLLYKLATMGVFLAPSEVLAIARHLEGEAEADGTSLTVRARFGGAMSVVVPCLTGHGPIIILGPEADESIHLHELGHIECGHMQVASLNDVWRSAALKNTPWLVVQEVQASRWALKNGASNAALLSAALQTYIDQSKVWRTVNRFVPSLANRLLGIDPDLPQAEPAFHRGIETQAKAWVVAWLDEVGYTSWEECARDVGQKSGEWITSYLSGIGRQPSLPEGEPVLNAAAE